jgi:hypothetical protein
MNECGMEPLDYNSNGNGRLYYTTFLEIRRDNPILLEGYRLIHQIAPVFPLLALTVQSNFDPPERQDNTLLYLLVLLVLYLSYILTQAPPPIIKSCLPPVTIQFNRFPSTSVSILIPLSVPSLSQSAFLVLILS